VGIEMQLCLMIQLLMGSVYEMRRTDGRTCPTGARHVLVVLDESYTCRSDTRRDLHVLCPAGVAVMLTCVKVNGPMLCSVEATVDIL